MVTNFLFGSDTIHENLSHKLTFIGWKSWNVNILHGILHMYVVLQVLRTKLYSVCALKNTRNLLHIQYINMLYHHNHQKNCINLYYKLVQTNKRFEFIGSPIIRIGRLQNNFSHQNYNIFFEFSAAHRPFVFCISMLRLDLSLVVILRKVSERDWSIWWKFRIFFFSRHSHWFILEIQIYK